MNEFVLFDEPNAIFAGDKEASDPHDGLALFGAFDSKENRGQMPPHAVIGTTSGVKLWQEWSERFNNPASCVDVARHRPWPPFVGFEVAFGAAWPQPLRSFQLDEVLLDESSRRLNKNERVYQVTNQYLSPFESIKKMDSQLGTVVCVVPDFVYQNCRPKSYVVDTTESESDNLILSIGKEKAKTGQMSFFEKSQGFGEAIDLSEQFGYSLDFRRQLKARVMPHGIPVQIVRESTLTVTDQVLNGEKGTNPLSDRLWNLGTSLYYKSGVLVQRDFREHLSTPFSRARSQKACEAACFGKQITRATNRSLTTDLKSGFAGAGAHRYCTSNDPVWDQAARFRVTIGR